MDDFLKISPIKQVAGELLLDPINWNSRIASREDRGAVDHFLKTRILYSEYSPTKQVAGISFIRPASLFSDMLTFLRM